MEESDLREKGSHKITYLRSRNKKKQNAYMNLIICIKCRHLGMIANSISHISKVVLVTNRQITFQVRIINLKRLGKGKDPGRS